MSGWDEVEVGDLCRIKHGYAFKGEFFEDAGHFLSSALGTFLLPAGYSSGMIRRPSTAATSRKSICLTRVIW